jgi:hypothetical protein
MTERTRRAWPEGTVLETGRNVRFQGDANLGP